jgi:hypothetical protein
MVQTTQESKPARYRQAIARVVLNDEVHPVNAGTIGLERESDLLWVSGV